MYTSILLVLLMVLFVNARHARMESAPVLRPPALQHQDEMHATMGSVAMSHVDGPVSLACMPAGSGRAAIDAIA